jgi:hypothetical protein
MGKGKYMRVCERQEAYIYVVCVLKKESAFAPLLPSLSSMPLQHPSHHAGPQPPESNLDLRRPTNCGIIYMCEYIMNLH